LCRGLSRLREFVLYIDLIERDFFHVVLGLMVAQFTLMPMARCQVYHLIDLMFKR